MRFLNPLNDVAFKKIFGPEGHKAVTIYFLNSILEYSGDDKISDVQFLNTEQKGILPDKKDNILDILCLDQAEFKEACQTASRTTWTDSEYNAYENSIVAADDYQGKIDYATKEAKSNIAKNLLISSKLTIEDIAKFTGFTIDEIKNLI